MNWNRDKNSWEEKAVNWRKLHVGLWKGNLNNELESRKGNSSDNELESRQELFGRKLCIEKYYCMLGLGGGKFKQWIGVVTRTFRKRKLCMEKSIACWALGGKFKMFKQWIGIVARTLQQRKLWMGGGNLNNELESRQELFGRENCASRNSIACWAWGGKFKQWIGLETITLRKRKLWMEKSIACSALGGEV